MCWPICRWRQRWLHSCLLYFHVSGGLKTLILLTQLSIESRVMWLLKCNKSSSAAVSFSSSGSVEQLIAQKYSKVSGCGGEGGDEWREANMQLFLIESAQSGSLTVLCSGLDQDHLWCWLKKGASSAGNQRATPFPRKISKIVGHPEGWAITIYGFSVDWDKSR